MGGSGYPSRSSMTYSNNFNKMDDDMPWYMKNKYDQMDDQSSSMNKFKLMMAFKKMMSGMKNDDSFMMEKMMPYDMMKNKYNNKYGNMKDNKMDMDKFEQMYAMISEMKNEKKQFDFMSNDSPAVMPMQRSVMPKFMETPDFEKMANFMMSYRSKRGANDDALALNDRLKEKIQAVFEQQQSKVGNMTCVLREMNCLNAENEIDVRAMKKDAEQYNIPVNGSRTDMKRSLKLAMRLPPPFLRSLTSKRSSRETSEPSTWDKSRATWDVARMPSKGFA